MNELKSSDNKEVAMAVSFLTSSERGQVKRLIEDATDFALRSAQLDSNGVQRLMESGDDFDSVIAAAIHELAIGSQYVNEEVTSEYGYPAGFKIKPIIQQVETLHDFFPFLNTSSSFGFASNILPSIPLPRDAEGWFAIPRWEKLANSYNEALDLILCKLASVRRFYNYRSGATGFAFLRQQERTARMLTILSAKQNNDILILPGQFGMRHAGRSMRRAQEAFLPYEFGLGAFAVGSMLLTHGERLTSYQELWIDCPGDECSPRGDGRFDAGLAFQYSNERTEFIGRWSNDVDQDFGTASALIPRSLSMRKTT